MATATNQPAVPATTSGPPATDQRAPAITNTTSASNARKVDQQAAYQALITGINAAYAPTYVFDLKTGPMARDELTAQLARVITAAETTKSLLQQYRTAVSEERTVMTQVRPLRSSVRGIIQAKIGAGEPAMAQFGFPPVKRAKRPAANKAAAAARAQQTRAVRSTKGKKQKAKVHAAPVTLVVEPAKAPATPATGAPAMPASSGLVR